MRRFWRKLRVAAVPLVISTVGLACGIAASFRAFGMSPGKAQWLGVGGAVLVVAGAILLWWPRRDQRVSWLWENRLSQSVLGEGRLPLLCRRHVTTRAQGRMLGCSTTASALKAVDWLEKMLLSVLGEMRMEVESNLRELAEQARLLAGLHKCIGVVVSMRFMEDLRAMRMHPDTSIGKKASAICDDLSAIAKQVKLVGLDPLDQLLQRLWPPYGNVDLPNQAHGEIRGAMSVVKTFFTIWADDLSRVRDVARALHDEVRQYWEQDRRSVQEDAECTPEDPEPAINIDAAAAV